MISAPLPAAIVTQFLPIMPIMNVSFPNGVQKLGRDGLIGGESDSKVCNLPWVYFVWGSFTKDWAAMHVC